MKKFKIYMVLVLISTLSLLLSSCGNIISATSVQLRKTEGDVVVNDNDGKEVEIKDDLLLFSGYSVKTNQRSYAWVDFDSVKLAKLDESSDIGIEKDGGYLTVRLLDGNLFFHVTKPLGDDESMEIRTSTMAVGIRGTCGWVDAAEGGGLSRVYILEGKVECNTDLESVSVAAGEMAYINEDGEMTVDEFDINDVPAFVLNEADYDDKLAEMIQEKISEQAESDTPALQDTQPVSETTVAMLSPDVPSSTAEPDNTAEPETTTEPEATSEPADSTAPTSTKTPDSPTATAGPTSTADPAASSSPADSTAPTSTKTPNSPTATADPASPSASNSDTRNKTDPTDYAIDWQDEALAQAMAEVTGIYGRDIMLSDVRGITVLALQGKGISNVSALGKLTSLTELDLYANNISDISALSSLTNLTVLWLSANNISDISALGSLTSLTELSLHSNNISDVRALSSLTNLTSLFLSRNNISDISALGSLRNLKQLSLHANNISDYSPVEFVSNLEK